MKFYLISIAGMLFLSSCLKQSIPDAILSKNSNGQNGTIATLSYQVNGDAVNISATEADNQDPSFYKLGCSKNPGYYALQALSSSGELVFAFYTDSLTTENYKYTGTNGEFFVLTYNGTNDYVHDPSDSISLNITSYNNGRISGNFSGLLTPLITAGNPVNIFGAPGSVLITNGVFENVPIFY